MALTTRHTYGGVTLLYAGGERVGTVFGCRRKHEYVLHLPGFFWAADGSLSRKGGATARKFRRLRDAVAEANKAYPLAREEADDE